MPLYRQIFLLFTLNFADAVLTIYWVRNGFATEGNNLMASLLEAGDLPFLLVKLAVGGIAAVVLWNWRHMRLARYGISLSLLIYTCIMVIHIVTGLSAFDMVTRNIAIDISGWTYKIISLIV